MGLIGGTGARSRVRSENNRFFLPNGRECVRRTDVERGSYQTWRATSATSSSLRCWVSSLIRFAPMDTGENPHWVDRASRSRPT